MLALALVSLVTALPSARIAPIIREKRKTGNVRFQQLSGLREGSRAMASVAPNLTQPRELLEPQYPGNLAFASCKVYTMPRTI
jgi:hypothetical protein